jgi:hypothetical protein
MLLAVSFCSSALASGDPAKSYMGINGSFDAFVDLVKSARDATTGNYYRKYPQTKDADGDWVAATQDANGWPSQDFWCTFINLNVSGMVGGEVPHCDNTASDISNHVNAYHLSFQCANPAPKVIKYSDPITTSTIGVTPDGQGQYFVQVDVWLNPGGKGLTLNITNTGATVNGTWIAGARNIKCIRMGYPANTTQVFTDDYLNVLAPFSTVRTMDITNSNAAPAWSSTTSCVSEWADRTWPTSVVFINDKKPARGWPWEYVIMLANTAHKDLWINIPIAATDDYVTQLAKLFKYGSDAQGNVYSSPQASPAYAPLDPALHVYVEYGNEIWNGSLGGSHNCAHWNLYEAQYEGTTGLSHVTDPSNLKPLNATDYTLYSGKAAGRRAGERLKRISDIFANVWGSGAINTTILPVYAWQLGNTIEDPCAWMNQNYGPVDNYIYGLANAPYFGTSVVQSSSNQGLTPTQCLESLEAGIIKNRIALLKLRESATFYNLKHLAYEGGPAMTDSGDLQAKYDANYQVGVSGTIGMDDVLKMYYNDFFSFGGDLNMYYSQNGWYHTGAYWGMLEYNSDIRLSTKSLPKWTAMNAVSQADPAPITVGTPVPATIPPTGWRFNEPDYQISNYAFVAGTTSNPYQQYNIYNATDDGSHYFFLQSPARATDPSVFYQFLINVPASAEGTYSVLQSCASNCNDTDTQVGVETDTLGKAVLQAFVDNQPLTAQGVTVPYTPYYNHGFQDLPMGTAYLNAGLHTIRIKVIKAGVKYILSGTEHSLRFTGLHEMVLVPVDVTNGLVSRWKFDNDLTDAVGPNNAVANGTITYVPGVVGTSAVNFTGSQYVGIANPLGMGLNTYTLSTWVKIAATPGMYGIVNTRVSSSNLAILVTGSNIRGLIGTGTTWINNYVDIEQNDTGSNGVGGQLVPGQWYHLAYVVDSSAKKFQLYLNGDLKKTVTYTTGTPLLYSSDEMRIGQSFRTSQGMNGALDDFRIYNRALSASEILTISNVH